MLGWFDTGKLKELRDATFFHPITTDDPIYKERYKPNLKGGLPTVRVQDSQGVTLYEESKDLPLSGEGLYSAIAGAVNGSEALLPWRRNHTSPKPEPSPDPAPGPVDPEPAPLDDGGAPVLDPVVDWSVVAPAIVIALFIIGLIVGQVEKSKQYHKGD